MTQWAVEMREYTYKMEYKKGSQNFIADHLSRPVKAITTEEDNSKFLGRTHQEMAELQQQKPRWQELIEYLDNDPLPKQKYPRATINQFMLEKDLLYFSIEKKRQ